MINHFRFLQRGINYATAATENYYLTKYNYDYSTTSERAFSIIQNMSICGFVAWWVSNSCSLNAYHTYCISDMTLKNTFLHGLNIIQEAILIVGIIIFLSCRKLKNLHVITVADKIIIRNFTEYEAILKCKARSHYCQGMQTDSKSNWSFEIPKIIFVVLFKGKNCKSMLSSSYYVVYVVK